VRRSRLRGDRARSEVRVHQFHPTLAPGDAMSNHVFALRKKMRHWGYDSFAYAVEAKPGVADVRSYRRLFREVNPDDLLIVHFSMGSEVVDQLIKIPARRVLVYHNITPPEFFSGINPHAAAFSRLGLRQLSRIAPAFEPGIGGSAARFTSRGPSMTGRCSHTTAPRRHSCRCPSTRVSACRFSRQCAFGCRSSRTTPPRSAKPWALRASCCKSAISPRLRRPPRW